MVKPPRRLSLLDVFCLGLNAIIGSGIFLFPGTLAALTGPASVLAFLLCGALLASVALCYAELGGMLRGNGAAYLYAREAFGEEAGYGVGVVAWSAAVLSWSAVAVALAAHLAPLHPSLASPAARKLLAASGAVLFGALNYRGIKPGAWTVNALTAAKVVPLAVFVIALLPRVEADRFLPLFSGEGRFGYAIFLALWALQGFEVAPVAAGETADPQRDVPRAVLGSLLFAAGFYALIQAAAVGSFPSLAASAERPLVDAAAHVLGPWGGRLLAAGGVLSMTGFVAGAALGAPRFLSALGEDSFRRLRLAEAHARFGTPYRAIAATTLAATVLIAVFPFESLIDLSNLAVVTQYLFSCLALLALRRSRPRAPRSYRAPWPWLTAGVGCSVSVWLMTQVSGREALWAAGTLAAAYMARRLSRRAA